MAWASRYIIVLLVAILSANSWAERLIMGTSDGPPYMIQATETGLDIDIPREVLKRIGYEMDLQFYPFARAMRELQLGKIHLTAPFFVNPPNGIFVSDPHIMYRPTIITRTSIAPLDGFDALKNLSIATFQGAKGYFGKAFVTAADASPSYIEHHDMGKLVSLLVQGRTDAVLLDYWIFNYYLSQSGYPEMRQQLRFHDFIPRVPAAVAFNDKQLRDRFNQGLKAIRQDGTYDKIVKRYSRYEE